MGCPSMNVLHALHVRTRGLELSMEDRETLSRRVVFAVDRFADRIRRVDVSLEDVNGPRGGVDVRCHVHVTLRDGVELDAESMSDTPLAAAGIALARVRRVVSRRVEKRVEERRSGVSLRDVASAESDEVTELVASS